MIGGSANIRSGQRTLDKGAVVTCSGTLHGVQSPGGDVVPCERLGPGLIEEAASDGRMRVWWTTAGFSTLLDSDDLCPIGPDARLVVVRRHDKSGQVTQLRHKVLGGLGLRHNWTVELRPTNVVRVVRWDGQAWTFRRNPIFSRVTTPSWVTPPDDDDAEALAAAELSLFR